MISNKTSSIVFKRWNIKRKSEVVDPRGLRSIIPQLQCHIYNVLQVMVGSHHMLTENLVLFLDVYFISDCFVLHLACNENTAHILMSMLTQLTVSHLLTLRAQLTRSSSLVITYSPLLLAAAVGLAAATAVLFSLAGTTLQQEEEEGMRESRVLPCALVWMYLLPQNLSHKLTLCCCYHF